MSPLLRNEILEGDDEYYEGNSLEFEIMYRQVLESLAPWDLSAVKFVDIPNEWIWHNNVHANYLIGQGIVNINKYSSKAQEPGTLAELLLHEGAHALDEKYNLTEIFEYYQPPLDEMQRVFEGLTPELRSKGYYISWRTYPVEQLIHEYFAQAYAQNRLFPDVLEQVAPWTRALLVKVDALLQERS